MTRNVGTIDRALRVVFGLLLMGWAITGWPTNGYSWIGWIGIVPLLTALVGFCPAYTLLGLSTCPVTK
ncbi:YgaP family membrane protein [Phreatobacter oligotrophus]|uniref:Inner membrane protein YgaP-like transmembrane domain-containing protein n=1 Tax=Phreatobacter oligotrophus TaxID=1122261 RepID=A0A2T4YLH3_9HYPH|nr:DUF2892 domain-containing protein [Phreatobacter oligotrophus]PTM44041.1 Protein of unknown function (DUF2892) [Phreatobacter oligotrophus]